jgi:electron transport complex protein RnfB
MSFVIAVCVLVGLGLLAGGGLAAANKVFGVEEDPRVEQITDVLPGANCGACGYPGCRGYAQAVLAGADICLCAPGGNDVVQKIAAILGVEAQEVVEKVALVKCAGTTDVTAWRSEYRGISDCHAAQIVGGGPNACAYGCLGLGSCQTVCTENAIEIRKGVAVVRTDLCIGCGACAQVCPRHLIEMVPKARAVHVLCNNHQSGKAVRTVCTVGCTACKLCTKKYAAFDMGDNLAQVAAEADDKDREAALVCPSGTIIDTEMFSVAELVWDPESRKKLKSLQKEHKKKQKQAKLAAKKQKQAKEKANAPSQEKSSAAGKEKANKHGGSAQKEESAQKEGDA